MDVIHTARGVTGYDGNLGDIDFYPNQGLSSQPGCWSVLASTACKLENRFTSMMACQHF